MKDLVTILEHLFFSLTMAMALAIPIFTIVLMLSPYFT